MNAKKILIIDDDAGDRELLRQALMKAGFTHEIAVAEEGETGVEKAKKVRPDIAIVDTQLPAIDGFETCRQIKAIPGLKTQVIVMTGHIDAVDATKARNAGADDYAVKTSDFVPLLETLRKLT